ncbi:hypothetical protein P280DRAFT_459150 [Massarina eburnea CBS 473.64]|uniref:Glycosyl transferase CAP10 domain-containing protein n=1 Tax=Massarina eburnea CBS 473.64 TaxID=1395130 RepID=A0A6A6RR02_9PLEO|nr:hypothetical protein P280DRAFT_459150 [Massarina eburnea CBS 473.64]
MDRKALLVPCGLVLGSSYVSTSIHASFALDRPLQTVAVVLLLAGLAAVAYEAYAQKNRRPSNASGRAYVAIPLAEGNGRPSSEEPWPLEVHPVRRGALARRAVAALLVALLFLLGARIALFWAVMREVECAGPTLIAFLPLVLALYHGFRDSDPSARPPPVWSAASPATSPATSCLDRFVNFFLHGQTRYILPSLLLAVSSFLTTLKTSALRSTYICPTVTSSAFVVPKLQFLGFVVDCIVVLVLYRLVDEGVVQSDSPPAESQDATTIHALIGYTFIASALVLAVAGIIVFWAMPEYREWMLTTPREYLLGLLRLSLMIPLMMLCFLVSARMYGVMGAVLITAFPSAYIGVLHALATGVSFSFPPKSTVSLSLCFTLLTMALALQLVADASDENRRPKLTVRLGRHQNIVAVAVLVIFSIGITVYRYEKPQFGHPISTLIGIAEVQHTRWASQAYQSKSLAEAVVHYQQRYTRDPPPHFDKWYEFATQRDSIVIDDFDNIEEDLAPFSSLSPADLRHRTAQVLANNEELGGIRVRNGKPDIYGQVADSERWMLEGTVNMIEKFAAFIPDMDLAFNLNDECRVAIPHKQFEQALTHRERYPEHTFADGTIDFRPDRASTWLETNNLPRSVSLFNNAREKPSFQTYGSVACSSETKSRRDRQWDKGAFCSTCSAPHSVGVFVANWTLAADPCHQPDIANLHGMHLSPAALDGTHELVPIFSQSRASGYADIRYPSPWNYMDKIKYEFGERYPDPNFAKKENSLFWRGTTSEGVSTAGSWKGMLRQRLVHLMNNETSRQPIFLPKGQKARDLEYVMEKPDKIKERLETEVDVRFIEPIAQCKASDCPDQKRELWFGNKINFNQHWRYRYLFDADGAGFSNRFIPFLQSNSVVFKTALFREWYEGRLTAWKHFVPVDIRLHDLFSSLAFFGGYSLKEGGDRMMQPKDRKAEAIARAGRVWTEKVLRKEDMEVYMFRLLLEWGRLTDDRRKDVGFRMDARGRKGKENG